MGVGEVDAAILHLRVLDDQCLLVGFAWLFEGHWGCECCVGEVCIVCVGGLREVAIVYLACLLRKLRVLLSLWLIISLILLWLVHISHCILFRQPPY